MKSKNILRGILILIIAIACIATFTDVVNATDPTDDPTTSADPGASTDPTESPDATEDEELIDIEGIEVKSPASGTYGVGQKITVVVTYSEALGELAENGQTASDSIKYKFGESGTERTASKGTLNGKTITYEITIQAGDNGKLIITEYSVIISTGDTNVESAMGDDPTVTGYEITANTASTGAVGEEYTWSDPTKVKLKVEKSSTGMNYNLVISGRTEKGSEGLGIYCNAFISVGSKPTIKYKTDGSADGIVVSETNGKATINMTPYFEKAGKVYITLVEYQLNTDSSKYESKIIETIKDYEITRPELNPLGTRMIAYFFDDYTSIYTHLEEPMYSLDNGAKINVKIGRVTDTKILKAIQNKESGALSQLLNYAKTSDKVYEGTFDNTQKHQETITNKFNVVDKGYYYVYMTIGGEYYPMEEVSLYQGLVLNGKGNLFDYLSDKFSWEIGDEADPTPTPTPDNTTTKNPLPQTGQTIGALVVTIAASVAGVIFYIKSKKYKI